MKNPFVLKQKYFTSLTIEQINDIFVRRIDQRLLTTYSGKYDGKQFNINGFKGGLPIKLKGEIIPENNGYSIEVVFKPVINPLILMTPPLIFFIYGLFADNFTLNGESTTTINRILFCLTSFLIFIFIIIVLTKIPLDREKRKLESELL